MHYSLVILIHTVIRLFTSYYEVDLPATFILLKIDTKLKLQNS